METVLFFKTQEYPKKGLLVETRLMRFDKQTLSKVFAEKKRCAREKCM